MSHAGPQKKIVECLVSDSASGTSGLATFLAQRLGLRLRLRSVGPGTGLGQEPLGPRTRLAVVGTGNGRDGREVLQAICTAPCPVLAVPPRPAELWGRPSRALRTCDRVLICGSDGSDASAAAVQEGATIAARCAARLLIARVTPEAASGYPIWLPVGEADPLSDDTDFQRRQAGPALIVPPPNGCAVHFCQRRGPVAETLVQLAVENAALMIVVGSDGLDPDQLALTGSLTAELLHEGTHPLLVVPRWWLPQTRTEEATGRLLDHRRRSAAQTFS